jgi:hypothetical protein
MGSDRKTSMFCWTERKSRGRKVSLRHVSGKNLGKPTMKTRNSFRIALIAVITSCAITQVMALTPISVPGLYNTGVDAGGVVRPQQSLELHYSVSGPVSTAYVVPPVFEPVLGWAWLAAPAGSAWIGPNFTTSTVSPDPVGLYTYTLQFDLTGYDPAQIRISGDWMTDNTGELLLNGNSTGFTTGVESYKALTAFSLEAGFVAGINTLEFQVLNENVGPNPTGLCVANLVAVAVPEPTSSSLLLIGLAGLWRCARRKS